MKKYIALVTLVALLLASCSQSSVVDPTTKDVSGNPKEGRSGEIAGNLRKTSSTGWNGPSGVLGVSNEHLGVEQTGTGWAVRCYSSMEVCFTINGPYLDINVDVGAGGPNTGPWLIHANPYP